MKIKYILLVTIAIFIGGGSAFAILPSPKTGAAVGVVTPDCGQVQPAALGIHWTDSSGTMSTQSVGITEQQAIQIANQKTFVRSQLPAPLVKTQRVNYSNDNRGVGTSMDDDLSADANLQFQGTPAWIVTYCGVVTYPHRRELPAGQTAPPIVARNEWNVVINAATGELIEEFSAR